MEQAQCWIGDTLARYYFYIHWNAFTRVGQLFIRLGLVDRFLLCLRKQAQLAHDTEQTLRAAGISSFFEPIHSSSMPRSGFLRRISRMSFSSGSVC